MPHEFEQLFFLFRVAWVFLLTLSQRLIIRRSNIGGATQVLKPISKMDRLFNISKASGFLRTFPARLPSKDHQRAGSYTFYAPETLTMAVSSRTIINTGIQADIPTNHIGLIVPEEEQALRGITVVTQVVDQSYKGKTKYISLLSKLLIENY